VFFRNYYELPARGSMQFRILRTLASGPKDQSIARVARRLGEYPDTISNALFRGDAEKFAEPNLLMSGLINFHVSGTKKPHFKLNLSFIGFLWYLVEERSEKAGIETFNEVKRLYNNFGYPLFMEHNALEHLFFLQYYNSGNEPLTSPQQTASASQQPGEYLLRYYKNDLLRKFFRYDYFESYPPLDVLLIGLYLMIPDDIIDTKTPHEIDQMIGNYSPKFLQPLLRCLYQRKKIIRKGITDKSSSSSSFPSWLVSHHHITSAANMEQDEIAKIQFAMLFLTNSDLLYPLINSKKYRSIAKKTAHDHDQQQQPVMSIELMYELSGFVENVLSQHLSQWKERKKTLRRIKEMLLSSSKP
jgi:hypothetical protein